MSNASSRLAVVIGANKGVGLAVTLLLKKEGYIVVACCRRSTPELDAAGVRFVVTGIDVTRDSGTADLQELLPPQNIDLLVIAAGAQQLDHAHNVTRQGIRDQFEVNALGPLFAVLELRSRLQKGSKVALISSRMGSITQAEFTGGNLFGYRMGKCALNMAGATLALDLKPDGIPLALIHPGVVNTAMLRNLRKAKGLPEDQWSSGSIEPEKSAQGILALIDKLDLSNSGSFWAADSGDTVPW